MASRWSFGFDGRAFSAHALIGLHLDIDVWNLVSADQRRLAGQRHWLFLDEGAGTLLGWAGLIFGVTFARV